MSRVWPESLKDQEIKVILRLVGRLRRYGRSLPRALMGSLLRGTVDTLSNSMQARLHTRFEGIEEGSPCHNDDWSVG